MYYKGKQSKISGKVIFPEILLCFSYNTQIEYIGCFIPHVSAENVSAEKSGKQSSIKLKLFPCYI